MKKFMKIAFVAAFVAVAGYGVYASQKSDVMSDLALANVHKKAPFHRKFSAESMSCGASPRLPKEDR